MFKRFAIGIAVLALVGACFTPSVPIPPPEPEDMAFEVDTDTNTVRFSHDANVSYRGAVVYVFNRTQGVGLIVTANSDGSVSPTAPFAGGDGDQVVVTFELETQLAAVCVEIHDGQSSSAFECEL